jgi:hypothetical protein
MNKVPPHLIFFYWDLKIIENNGNFICRLKIKADKLGLMYVAISPVKESFKFRPREIRSQVFSTMTGFKIPVEIALNHHHFRVSSNYSAESKVEASKALFNLSGHEYLIIRIY